MDNPLSRTSINNVLLLHLLSCLRGLVFVDPIRLVPVIGWDKTELHFGVGHHTDTAEQGEHANDIRRLQRNVTVRTHFLKSSVNSTSLRNTHG
jgi:hypothetical protein